MSASDRRASTQALRDRMAELAPDLGVTLEPQSPDTGRMIGVAFMAAAHSASEPGDAGMPATVAADDAAIKALIAAWSTLHPDDVLAKWKDLAVDPYVVVASGEMREVDHHYLTLWLQSDQYADFIKDFTFHKPRRNEVSNVNIVHVGNMIASVTYAERETATDGKVYVGNAVAIVMKKPEGWRVAVVSKMGDFKN